MFRLRTIPIFVVVSLISIGSGADAEQKSAYEVAFNCTKALWDANLAYMQAKGGRSTAADKIEGGCRYIRVRKD